MPWYQNRSNPLTDINRWYVSPDLWYDKITVWHWFIPAHVLSASDFLLMGKSGSLQTIFYRDCTEKEFHSHLSRSFRQHLLLGTTNGFRIGFSDVAHHTVTVYLITEWIQPSRTHRSSINIGLAKPDLAWKLVLSPRVLQHPYSYMVSRACYWNHYALIKTAGLTSSQCYGYPSLPLDSSSPMTVSFTCKTWLVMRSSSLAWPLGSACIPLPLSSVSSPKVGTGFYIITPREELPGS